MRRGTVAVLVTMIQRFGRARRVVAEDERDVFKVTGRD